MPAEANTFAVVRIQKPPAPEPERVEAAVNVRFDNNNCVCDWGPLPDAGEFSPYEAARILAALEPDGPAAGTSPGCVEPDEIRLLTTADRMILELRAADSPDEGPNKARQLAFPPHEASLALFQAVDAILSGSEGREARPARLEDWYQILIGLGTIGDEEQSRGLSDSLWQQDLIEEQIVNALGEQYSAQQILNAQVVVKSPDSMVFLMDEGDFLHWDPNEGNVTAHLSTAEAIDCCLRNLRNG